MFNVDEKFFFPHHTPPVVGEFPPEKPRYTITEEYEHMTKEMRATIDRLVKFERRLQEKFDDMLKHLTSDNVLFKNTFAESHRLFLESVKNEINVFEGNVDSSIALFKTTLETDYATLSEDVKAQIVDYYKQFVTKLNEYKAELNGVYDEFRDAIESRLTQYNDNYVESFNNYTTSVNLKITALESSLSRDYATFVNQVTTSITEFKNDWVRNIDARLDGQDSVINDAVLYLKTNLTNSVTVVLGEMTDNGDFASIIESEVFGDFNNRLLRVESSRVMPETYGAIGDGETDDTSAIQTAIDRCNVGDTLVFANKTYCINEPLKINKKIHIDGNNCKIKAMKTMDTVFAMTSQSSLAPSTITRVNVKCENVAIYGFKVGGDSDATQITFNECTVEKAISHGFYIIPVAYCIYFNRCRSMYNGEDGFNAVGTSGAEQMNAICFYGCTAQLNTKNGFYVHGMNHVISECNSEKNEHGIKIGGVNYPAYNMVIRGCYLEENNKNQIYINPIVYCIVAIHDNFLYSTKVDEDTAKVTHVKCSGGEYQLRLDYRRNTTYGENVLEIDGGSTIDFTSYADTEKVMNMRCAKIDTPISAGVRHYLPVSLSAGTPHEKGYTYKSVNMVNDDTKNIMIMLPFKTFNSVLRQVGFTAETDGTTAKVNVRVSIYNPERTLVKGTNFTFTLNASGNYVENCMNNMLWYNIPNECYVEVSYVLTDVGNATSVVLSNLFIDVFN